MTTITVTFRKTQDAQPTGIYTPTSVDAVKKNADFLLVQVCPNVIKWNSGKTEIVTAAKLRKLQLSHTWATDF